MSESSEFRNSAALVELTKDNYNTWRIQAEALLRVHHLWDHVEKDKESILDAYKRELWMKKDKQAKSELILCISSSLLPLVENCTTTREVWLKLANVYGNKGEKLEDKIENSDTDDEDTIIYEIENCVDDFFDTINNSSVQKISAIKKSLTTTITQKLFLQLKINGIKKLPDEKIVVNTVNDFIDEIDKLSKSELKTHTDVLSNELIDVLLLIFNINPHKNDATDEDAVINNIENSVEEFFKIINDSSQQQITKIKKLLSTNFTDKLLSQLKTNNIKQLPDKEIIVKTISNFIDDIDKLSKTEIKTQKNELSCKLIDNLLLDFNINPYKNDNDEAKINTDGGEIQDNVVDGNKNKETNRNLNDLLCGRISSDSPGTYNELLRSEQQFDNADILRELYSQQGDCRNAASPALVDLLYTPPATPRPKRSYKCGICHEEGHNRTTCPLNKSDACSSKSATTISETPKRSYSCGVCGGEGHNRTSPSCPFNQSVVSASKPIATIPETPKRSYSCGLCGGQGHNRTSPSCPFNQSVVSASKPIATIPETPKRSYSCGLCGGQGHNRTSPSCPFNQSAVSASKSTSTISETPKRSYSCGLCGGEGHNRTSPSCPFNQSVVSASKPIATIPETPKRSYSCGLCGGQGHNRTSPSCPFNQSVVSASKPIATIPETPKRSYSCGLCGGQGHNRTSPSCPFNQSAVSASKSTSTISETPKRSYSCGLCGGEGHNRTSCPVNKSAVSASKSTSTISETPKRSYSCGLCGGEGHNRTSCPYNQSAVSASKSTSTISETPKRSYSCGSCGGEGHNRTSCPYTQSVVSASKPSSYSSPSYSLYSTPAPTRAAPKCGSCGEEGHNSRTCGRRGISSSSYSSPSYLSSYSSYSAPAPSYSSYSSYSGGGGGGRSYTCSNCGGSGHNRRTCQG